MLILLTRTILVYIFLLITMRMMGKRQLGELEISELISTLLLSDIAALPITNQEIPLAYAFVPILAITTFEITTSLLLTKIPKLKNILSPRPSMLIRKGRIDKKELLKNRISIDELITELRQKGITDITEVEYAIIEQNGNMTVIPKSGYAPPSRLDLGIKKPEGGLCHIIIADGVINDYGLHFTNKSRDWLNRLLKKEKKTPKEIFLMTLDDNDTVQIIEQNQIHNIKAGRKTDL
jgi:uncharacterized membrane protein YcaP (DUF421 family)